MGERKQKDEFVILERDMAHDEQRDERICFTFVSRFGYS